MNAEAIKKILPHRYPFLLVDRILEMHETKAVGLKNVTANEPFFQGHFPEKAVMPGVLLIEVLAQLGACLVLSKPANKGKMVYLIAVNDFRFRKIVVPGDQLRIEMEGTRMKSKVGVMRGKITVEGQEVCGGEIMYSLVDADSDD